MRCKATRGLLDGYREGRLPPEVDAKVEEHLAACEACRAELKTLDRTMSLLDEWGPTQPTLDYADLRYRLARRAERRAGMWLPVPRWAAAGMALASAILGLWFGSVGGPNLSSPTLPPNQVVAQLGMNPTDDAIEDSLLAGMSADAASPGKGTLR